MSLLKDVLNTPSSRKRSRSDSSPIFGDLSPFGIDDLEALCKIEEKYIHVTSPLAKKRRSSPNPGPAVKLAAQQSKTEDATQVKVSISLDKLPTTSHPESTSKLPPPAIQAIGSAATKVEKDEYDDEFEELDISSIDVPPEPDLDSWFQPVVESAPTFVSFVRPSVGPNAASKKLIQPSAAALQAAKKLFAAVEAEVEKEIGSAAPASKPSHFPPKAINPSKPPSSRELKAPSVMIKDPSQPSTIIPVASHHEMPKAGTKAPVLTVAPRSTLKLEEVTDQVNKSAESTPSRKADVLLPLDAPTPIPKHLGMRSRPQGKQRAKFATPWKNGPRLSLPDSKELKLQALAAPINVPIASTSQTPKQPARRVYRREAHTVFDLNPPTNRRQLKSLGIDKRRSIEPLKGFDIPAAVGDVETWNALYWAFDEDGHKKDVHTAFDDLLSKGCSLLEKAWLENHWTLIIWKLANMVVLWPSTQGNRWNYQEVLKQLLYRYEREINRCERPAIRLIQERDASAYSAMVLCVFEILWPTDKERINTRPEFVLTDGWYKIRAQTDDTLARAARKRRIRVGAKLEIIGARLEAPGKEANDVLAAFGSSALVISGNGTHLVPWHTKLGFKTFPSAATLNSLTADGGSIPLLPVTIMNAFPIVFIETPSDGDKITRSEEEEDEAKRQWQRRREDQATKLQDDSDKQLERLIGLVDSLQYRAGTSMGAASEDTFPDDIEDLVDDLEESETPKATIKSLSPSTAAAMALFMQTRMAKKREEIAAEVFSELESRFPPRNIRCCRVLLVKDAVNVKRPSLRTAQITVWDAEALGKDALIEGKAYMITNLIPTLPKAWGKPGKEGQVFLVTKRDTKWRRIATKSTS